MSKNSTDKASVRKRGIMELVVGLAVAAFAGFISWQSYETADYGEQYTIYYGPIILGAAYAVLGLVDVAFPQLRSKKAKKSDDAVVATSEGEKAKDEVVVEED